MSSKCRVCGHEVIWAVTSNGRPIPIEPDTFDESDRRLEYLDHKSKFGLKDMPMFSRVLGHIAHFEFCGQGPQPDMSIHEAYQQLFLLALAPDEVVASAYRTLVKMHHPDVGGDERKMLLLNLAMETIEQDRKGGV